MVEVIAMKELRIIDTEEIKEYFFGELFHRGYLPTEEEAETIADICFDYLLEIGVIEEDVI
jgi:hypothetical protein